MLLRPRLLFFEKTRPRIEFERGYKFTYLLAHDACSVSIKKVPNSEVMREHSDNFLGRPIDPDGVEKATRMFLRAHWITERAKAQLEELLMTFEVEKAEEPAINAECVRLAAALAESPLTKIPKKFKNREAALERYNAIRAALAEQDKAIADAKAEDSEAAVKEAKKASDASPNADAPKKQRKSKDPVAEYTPTEDVKATQKKSKRSTTTERKEKEMATKKPKTKGKKTARPTAKKNSGGKRNAFDPDSKVRALVKPDEIRTRNPGGKPSLRMKVLTKIAGAGARGIAIKSLGNYGNNLTVLLAKKHITFVK